MIDRVAVDGRPAGAGDLGLAAAARYGHFTAMQVRGGRVRGLALHLARLRAANEELFGAALDEELVLATARHALGGAPDASVRVIVAERDGVRVIATAAPPHAWPDTPLSLLPVRYARYLPHVKHLGGFPQAHLARSAPAAGFDDVLFTDADGFVSESSIANLGCFDGERLLWPDAPMLRGITMALLEEGELPSERRPLKVADLAGRPAVFLTNSWGVVPVSQVGDLRIRSDEAALARVRDAYEGVPWDVI
ncbi:aminotransferase class IV [Nonomuraea rhodomycinica]|uniref:aminotransferase class IV n=1 Tax=Nonomuraea rhodomycinica TaxID=1712872 RepID=UPI001C37CC42|nr:aminotransferase class IV [Nonomuraea rhodomycinica]